MSAHRDAALAQIRSNIDRYGQHVYLVMGAEYPRFSYSIGLSARVGFELIIGGSTYYSNDQVVAAINEAAARLSVTPAAADGGRLELPVGNFTVGHVHASWARELALGVFDYYDSTDVRMRQLIPSADARTIDVPDMAAPWSAAAAPVWRWLREPWPFDIPESSTVVTNDRAMRGEPVTEGLRRDDDTWEIFVEADPDVPQADVYVVPLSTLLGFDPTLEAFTTLPVGDGLQRRAGGPWTTRR